jgi:hypothetical protein
MTSQQTRRKTKATLLFADDLCHLEIYRNHKQAEKRINVRLKKIQDWLDKWKLKMAVHKCTYVIIHDGKKAPEELEIIMNNAKIARVKQATLLGVTIDEKLNFKGQLETIESKCSERLNITKLLSNRSWHLDQKTQLTIFNTLVRSTFEYSAILTPRLSEVIKRLQIIQNIALRSILHSKFNRKTNKNTKTSSLHERTNQPYIKTRLAELGARYIVKSLENSNPIITECAKDFMILANTNKLFTPTLFDLALHTSTS